MKLAVDAMGGDNAPEAPIAGVMKALDAFPNLEVILVGDEKKMAPYLTQRERLTILHTEEKIEGTDEPVRAVRRKKQASLVLAAKEVKENRADACLSAGNTGALMAAGLFIVGRMEGIDRPALAPTLPTTVGNGFLLIDAGANMDAKPEYLVQYAIMGSVYAEKVRGVKQPRVGLLNVGTEDKKGNELCKQAFPLLKEAPVHFVGNVEARDVLNGVCDVLVTDGFAGNVLLKTVEGTALSIFSMLKEQLLSSFTSKMGALLLKPQLKQMKAKLDYSEYGGAGLFGLKAPVIKAHGSSDPQAFFSAIRQAKNMVEQQVVDRIIETIEEMPAKGES
ncbi:phosphate acyltransferase PlsX [Massilibacterium senegalense]|uniref:phosphate acyltransferase PlsX n=1 Tax=Massilibacterium senegalense TaxID=1632858 RepID=UPI00078478A0|nr:phosphate acyltransferase PlsX [Massilibacterium senegalense]